MRDHDAVVADPGHSPAAVTRGQRAARIAALCLCVLVCLPNLVYPLFEDTALFYAIGELMHRGAMPYADLFDQKPPAIYALTWAATGLFGASSLVARSVEIAVIALMAVAVGRVARASGWQWAEPIGIALTGLWSSVVLWGLPELGQVELYQSCAMAWGAALALEAGASRRRAVAAGALLALACWFKPQAVLFAVAVTALVGARSWRAWGRPAALRALLAVAAGGVAVTGLFAAWMFAAGIADDFATAIAFNRAYVSRGDGPPALLALRWLVPGELRDDGLALALALGAVAGGGVATVRAGRPWLVALLAVWWLAAYAQFYSGYFLFGYHALVVVPALAASAAVGLGAAAEGVRWLLRRSELPWLRVGGALAFALALWMALGTTPHWRNHASLLLQWWSGQRSRAELDQLRGRELHYYRFAAQRRAADYVRARTEPGDRVQVIGRAGAFYLHVDRLPASRWLVTSSAFNPTVRPTLREEVFSELMRELDASEPVYVLVRLDDALPWFGLSDSWAALQGTALATWLQAHYRHEADLDGFRVFRRQRS